MGKTTLLEQLIPLLTARGRVVSLVKPQPQGHRGRPAGQGFLPPARAGCQEVLLLGEGRWALMHELRGAEEPPCPTCSAACSTAIWC